MEELEKRYGEALFLAAKDLDKLDVFYDQLIEMRKILSQNGEIMRLFDHPNIEKDEKKSILDKIFKDRIEKELLNFFKILIDKNRTKHYYSIISAYVDFYFEYRGIMRVKAISAYKLIDDERSRLIENLKEQFGKEIDLEEEIDEAVIGGLLLEADGKVLDGTVRNKLDQIRQVLVSH